MPTIKTQVAIGASAEMVWRILTNFPAYPRWNPFIREVNGKAEVGARLKMRLRLSKDKTHRLSVRITKSIPASELHWRSGMLLGGLFDREQSFIIVPNGVNGVHFIQRLRFSGLLSPLIVPFIGRKSRAAVERMNVAVKQVAEAKH